jgi:hypothetical protein
VPQLQCLAHRRDDRQRLLRREATPEQRLPQIHSIDELHEQIEEAAGLPEVMNSDDVRMAERRQRLRVEESRGKIGS